MKRMYSFISLFFLANSLCAEVDLDVVNRIRAEGIHHSRVMYTLEHLTDVIGPRLTGSPGMQQASHWTKNQLRDWGLKNAHLENFEFGRGWDYDRASIHLTSPRKTSFDGIPVAWTPGTHGPVSADVVHVDAVNEEELLAYAGQLKNKFVLFGEAKPIGEPSNSVFERYNKDELDDIGEFKIDSPASHQRPEDRQDKHEMEIQHFNFTRTLSDFLQREGAAGVIYRSRRDAGLVRVFGHDHRVGKTFSVPAIVIEAEHYNLLARLIQRGVVPKVELNIVARFFDDDPDSYNTIADIPGRGRNPEIVVVGGHLDSWHIGGGAVDNGAGVAVAMEAVRILSTLNIKPKRTIRIALWSGEEQGLFGSRAYINQHVATRPQHTDAKELELSSWYRETLWPIKKLKGYDKHSAYFNIDNGSGRFRGIYTEGNVAVKPIFSEWFEPFSDLSEGLVSINSTYGTDHESFDDVGLPGFQFIQDRLDYFSRLHHTHVDSFDHVVEDDLKQASTILASFLYNAATRDDLLPREVMPSGPSEFEKQQATRKAKKATRDREREAKKNLTIKAH
jgi:carboxypeptidase Q